MDEIVGRDEELAAVDAFVVDAERGPRTLVLEGEPGIGKTILWRAGVERARDSRSCVLSAWPAEAETALPFSGLADLLGPVLDRNLVELPEPQRHALDVALLRKAPRDDHREQLALDRAVLGCLWALAAEGPVLIAIDDVQWLDAPTVRVLTFALRRLDEVPVQLFLSRRAGESNPLELERSAIGAASQRVELGPLSVDAIDELLATRLGLHLARPRLRELHRLTQGNPYFALEIARPLSEAPEGSDGELHVPPTLRNALGRRIAALSEPARHTLVLVAATSSITSEEVAALPAGDGLAESLDAGILTLEREDVRFSHPLLASISYDEAGEPARRDAHRQLAMATGHREERVLHLALASEAPDEALASELERASEEAWARGAPETAASLLEHAARLTPPKHEKGATRRLTLAAEHLQTAGDLERARAMFRSLIDRLRPGPQRARVLARLAGLESDPTESKRRTRQALDEAGDDLALRASLSVVLHYIDLGRGDLRSAAEDAAEALRLAEAHGDRRLLAVALTIHGRAKSLLGRAGWRQELERAMELEQARPERKSVFYPRTYSARLTMGLLLTAADDLEQGRSLILDELERAHATHQEMYRARILNHLAFLELRAGDWAAAVRYSKEGLTLARQSSKEGVILTNQYVAALVDAHLGRLEEAVAAAEEGVVAAGRAGDPLLALQHRAVLGFVELSRGNPQRAAEHLAGLAEAVHEQGTHELSWNRGLADQMEALVAIGELERAEEIVELLEERGRPLNRAWALAIAARGRALVRAARGDLAGARASLEQALAEHERLPDPFELGRTLLVRGTIERRAKRKRPARDALAQALEIFDRLGAPLWAEKAAGELARVGGRRPSGSTLTPTERRVAELVAEGRSNKEVAAILFVATHTVEGHLTRVYEKLGLHSRTELTRRLARDPTATEPR